MREITGEILFVYADDSHTVLYRGPDDKNIVNAIEYESRVSLMESIWAPVDSQIHDNIIKRNKE